MYFPSLEADAAGNNARVVYAIHLADQSLTERLRLEGNVGLPVVSPDGCSVAYHTLGAAVASLFVRRADETQPTQLASGLSNPSFPVWLPDFSGLLAEVEQDGSTHSFEIPLHGAQPVRITRNPGLHWPHSVLPNSSRIAFASWRDGAWNVWWIDRRTGEVRRLTSYQSLRSFVRYPAWSPKGDRIVFELSVSKGNIHTVEWP